MNDSRLRRVSRLVFTGASLLCLVLTAAAQGTVNLYENSSYGGSSAAINLQFWGANVPWALSAYGFNDKATSLSWSLAVNTAVTFYENSDGSGAQWHISRTAPRVGFNANIGATYNDTWSAFSWQFDDPSIGGTVTLYEHSGFGGIAKRLPLSSYQEGALHALSGFNDKATGIVWTLQPDVVVTFYEHPNGTGREYTLMHGPASGSISAVSPYYNDKFSSFRWRHVDPTQGWVRLCTDAALGGYELTRYVSETGLAATSLGPLGYNDQIDSMQWQLPLGTSVLLYDHDPKGGACYSLTDVGTRDVHNSAVLHDSISVFEVVDGDVDACLADRTLPYDRNCYLASHNAHVAPAYDWAVWNQDLAVTHQLDYGARTLQLDTMLNGGTIHLVHGSWTATLLQLASGGPPMTLQAMLQIIQGWMGAHPREVLTLIFENHDGPELGDYLLDQSPIKDQIYVHQHGAWPTLAQLIQSGKRYVVFEMNSSPRSGRIPWQYDHSVENDYGGFYSVTERAESRPIDAMQRGLFYMNNINPFPPSTWVPGVTPNDFASLVTLMAAFPQFPNYVGVDRITAGGEGGADAVRYANTALRTAYATRASFSAFGFGNCGGRGLVTNSRPRLGTTLQLEVRHDFPGNAAFEFMIYGSSDQFAGPLPLPFLLPPTFGTGCTLRVCNEVVFGLGIGGYPIPVPVALPANPALNGVDAYFQSLGLDAVTGEFVMSNAGRARLGMF